MTSIENAADLSQMAVINLLSHSAGGKISQLAWLITEKDPA